MTDRGKQGQNPLEEGGFKPKSPEELAKLREAKKAVRAAWPPVRQPHSDDVPYLKGILADRGIQFVPEAEPATAERLKRLLRRGGFTRLVGIWGVKADNKPLTAEEFIERNPGKALWWLVAITIEGA